MDNIENFERALSRRKKGDKIKTYEIKSMHQLVNILLDSNCSMECFENWFYSYNIENLGKELDLIKVCKNGIVINVELKSQMTSHDEIKDQLIQNRTYLSILGSEIYSFTFVEDIGDGTSRIFEYNQELKECSPTDLISAILKVEDSIEEEIDNFFTPSMFLVSPLNSPSAFIGKKYILTKQQREFKSEIIKGISEGNKLWGITGEAGTGKTLLLYDMAMELKDEHKVCIIHGGNLCNGHYNLNRVLENLRVYNPKVITDSFLSRYDVLCIDESHRLYKIDLDLILSYYDSGLLKGLIFSYDPKQMLSISELKRNNPERLNKLSGFNEMVLSKNIRTNDEIYSFTRAMFDLKDISKAKRHYDNVDILYARNIEDANKIIKIYEEKKYKMVSLSPSLRVKSPLNEFEQYDNTHRVLGQEFDSVIVVINNDFEYNDEGKLGATVHPNPDYLSCALLYENVTRARKKLCIVVLNNYDVFKKLLNIKMNINNF